jgi:hypothetical protein
MGAKRILWIPERGTATTAATAATTTATATAATSTTATARSVGYGKRARCV